ncbi:alpha/beta hydrolase [Mycobacterium aquaticum]|uniref:alpha/beta hydrolase n=1 Tax=Mycobacterium aquaticum TaxID=1927124 RepID=UPI001FECB94D|nr:alpha/beta hydrolase [Mycobacterium aquaticum]
MVLEPATQSFLANTAALPAPDTVSPAAGRRMIDNWQREPVESPLRERRLMVAGATGPVRIRMIVPPNAGGRLPVLFYLHGGGWVFGSARSHARLVRELAVMTGAAIVFPEYSLSPEVRYPVALNEIWSAAQWVFTEGGRHGLDTRRIAMGGDGVGATMAITLVSRCLRNGHSGIRQFVGFCPVTDASCDAESHRTYGEGYHLRSTTMRWFWDQYLPDSASRTKPTVSPLRTPVDELAGFPPSLVITAEADVVRDEGEAFAAKLFAAGVPTTAVRYDAVIHGFVVVNALCGSDAARAATAQATSAITSAFGS